MGSLDCGEWEEDSFMYMYAQHFNSDCGQFQRNLN